MQNRWLRLSSRLSWVISIWSMAFFGLANAGITKYVPFLGAIGVSLVGMYAASLLRERAERLDINGYVCEQVCYHPTFAFGHGLRNSANHSTFIILFVLEGWKCRFRTLVNPTQRKCFVCQLQLCVNTSKLVASDLSFKPRKSERLA